MNETAEDFVERMGLATQADGLPRIAGRIFGYFVLNGGTRSFSALAENLQVSRGSVSTNTRLLEALGVLERITHPGDRQDYFRLSDDPYGRLLGGYVERMQRTRDVVHKALAVLPKSDKGARSRLLEMDRFYRTALENTLEILREWRGESPRRSAR